MRVGLNTQLRTCGCHRVHCSILVTTCPWKICLYNANMQRPFFLQTYLFLLRAVRTASESTEKCVQSTEISVQFGPIRNKRIFFSKNAPFFSRPSVHPSKLFQQLAPQDQGEWMCSNPVYVPHKCRNVQMSATAAHYKKQAKVLYISTRIVDPKLFSHEVLVMCLGLNDV